MTSFLWGTATAAYQIEGGNFNNDWWAWEQAGHIRGGDSARVACDSWHRWREDLDLVQALGNNAYRFSIEWSRIEPEEGHFDEAALAQYQEMVWEMRKRGIEPVLTLHHFTNPLWLANRGGCESHDFPDAFRRFAECVVPALARDVRYWVTINEPNVVAFLGYLYGIFPPGVKSFSRAGRALRQMLLAHATGYRVIKSARSDSLVSIAINVLNARPASAAPWDRLASQLVDQGTNRTSIEALLDGKAHLPLGLTGKIPGLAGTLDYIGLNYYTRNFYGLRPKGGLVEVRKDVPRSDMDQEIYPQGFYEALKQVAAYGKPVLVTESGIADRQDRWRPQYLRDLAAGMQKAMTEGVQVIGYLHWSLMDNFEWNEGYHQCFGLYAVDFQTGQRTPRPSAAVYKAIIENQA